MHGSKTITSNDSAAMRIPRPVLGVVFFARGSQKIPGQFGGAGFRSNAMHPAACSFSGPEPRIRAAQNKLGIDPRNIIAIGDTQYDAESASKTGMATIGLLVDAMSLRKATSMKSRRTEG